MTDPIPHLERCAAGDTSAATLPREECVLVLELWAAANETVAFHAGTRPNDEVSKPLVRLRRAIRKVARVPEEAPR